MGCRGAGWEPIASKLDGNLAICGVSIGGVAPMTQNGRSIDAKWRMIFAFDGCGGLFIQQILLTVIHAYRFGEPRYGVIRAGGDWRSKYESRSDLRIGEISKGAVEFTTKRGKKLVEGYQKFPRLNKFRFFEKL
mgnify:CR=1 FL=1